MKENLKPGTVATPGGPPASNTTTKVNNFKGELPPSHPKYTAEKHKKVKGLSDPHLKFSSMRQKLQGITNRGNFRCKNCNQLAPYHKDDDVINMFVTSSTLAHSYELCYKDTGLCDHTVEIFELNGLKIGQVQRVMLPIIKELIKYNKVRILFAIGANNMLAGLEPGTNAIEEFDNFCTQLGLLSDKFDVTFEFIDLPFIPCITQLKGETHGVKIERVNDIIELNKAIHDQNTLCSTGNTVPTLSHCGIDNCNVDIKENRHLIEEWREKPLTNATHLADKIKIQKWMEILQYYKDF